ncbi:MAG: protein jag [Actinomycetota bacterium]
MAVKDFSDSKDEILEESEIAADYLELLLDLADVNGDLEVYIEDRRPSVSIVGSDDFHVPQFLIGSRGEVIDALQDLTRLMIFTQTGKKSTLLLDIASYRAKKKDAASRLALGAATRAKSSMTPQSLPPMTAFERKVAHSIAFREGCFSESNGDRTDRYVTIYPPSST